MWIGIEKLALLNLFERMQSNTGLVEIKSVE